MLCMTWAVSNTESRNNYIFGWNLYPDLPHCRLWGLDDDWRPPTCEHLPQIFFLLLPEGSPIPEVRPTHQIWVECSSSIVIELVIIGFSRLLIILKSWHISCKSYNSENWTIATFSPRLFLGDTLSNCLWGLYSTLWRNFEDLSIDAREIWPR